MKSKIGIIIGREYLERVRKKSFIITTLLMPILMLGLMCLPALIMTFQEASTTRVAVIDASGKVSHKLANNDVLTIIPTTQSVDSARIDERYDAVLYIPANILDEGATVDMYTNEASSMLLEEAVSSQIDKAVESIKVEQYDIPQLDDILKKVKSEVSVRTFRNDRETGESREASVGLSYGLGMLLSVLLYMCLLLYGQMVMTSIIEEKNNRVLEIVVSSVKSTQLMFGKICGICMVAVSQILIWGVLVSLMSAFVLPALIPQDVASELAAMNSGAVDPSAFSTDSSLLSALSVLGNVGYIIKLFVMLILFLIGGFILYAAIYAAIGSAVDNIQDASQLQTIIVVPIIIGIMAGVAAAADPTSSLAMWTSFIPFTSPMVMMARIPFDIPDWQIWTSLVILYLSFMALVWIAAKIYRVGIFMYGKKPTFKELIRWMRYK